MYMLIKSNLTIYSTLNFDFEHTENLGVMVIIVGNMHSNHIKILNKVVYTLGQGMHPIILSQAMGK